MNTTRQPSKQFRRYLMPEKSLLGNFSQLASFLITKQGSSCSVVMSMTGSLVLDMFPMDTIDTTFFDF